MARYVRRVQAMFTDEQFRALTTLAEQSGKAVGVLVREATERALLGPALAERRQAALARMLALKAPAPDWDTMEEEIIRGAVGDRAD
jgi:hypothetical protein